MPSSQAQRPGSVPPQQQAPTPTSTSTSMSNLGPPSVPGADSIGNPPSNLPSIGSVPTPGGGTGSGGPSQPGSVAPATAPTSVSGGAGGGQAGPGSVGPGGQMVGSVGGGAGPTSVGGGGGSGTQPGSVGPPGGGGGAGTGSGERSGPPSVLAPLPNLPNVLTRDQQALFGPLLETIASSLKSPFLNHTLERTFGQCLESLFGPEIRFASPLLSHLLPLTSNLIKFFLILFYRLRSVLWYWIIL